MRPSRVSALHYPLDHVLGSPARVRVLRVLVEHGGALGVSDIARRARLTLPSTREALRRLIEANVVSGTGAGRTMVCALDKTHPLAATVARLFTEERAYADRILDGIRAAARRVSPVPTAVWLFGSVARGEDSPASDIDVALVSSERDPGRQAEVLRQEISTALQGRDDRVSVVAFSLGDVRRLAKERAPIWSDIQRDGAVLFGADPESLVNQKPRARKRR